MTTKQKKTCNPKRKGNSAELELSKLFSKHFGLPFARVGAASGARPKNTKLPDSAIGVMTGDLIVPHSFRFSVECKAVNIDIDFLAPSALFDKWLVQAKDDARSIHKTPLLCWKRHRKGWIAAVPLYAFVTTATPYPLCFVMYRSWAVTKLDTLLGIYRPAFWFMDEEDG